MSARSLFRVRAFGPLMLAYTLNELAWAVGTLALAVLVFRRTGSVLGSTGFFLLSQVAPGFVAPLLVARLERFSPRRVLPALYWMEALLFAILAWLMGRFALVPVLALVLIDGLVALAARSLAGAVRAEILKPVGLLHDGNALTNAIFSVCFMAGPLLGGVVVATGGMAAAMVVNACLFAAIGASLASAALPSVAARAGSAKRRVRAALAHVRSDVPLRTLLSLQGVGVVLFTIATPVEVVYAEHTLAVGAAGYGALLAAWGGGAVVGSLIYVRWSRANIRALIAGGAFAIAVGFGVMTVATTLAAALVGAALAGIANGVVSAAFMTETQDLTPRDWMALVTTLIQAIRQVAPGLGILLGGVIAEAASARSAFGVAAAGSLVFASATLTLLSPRRLQGARTPQTVVVPSQPEPDAGPDPGRAGAVAAAEVGVAARSQAGVAAGAAPGQQTVDRDRTAAAGDVPAPAPAPASASDLTAGAG